MQPDDREQLLWRLAETEGQPSASTGASEDTPAAVPDDVLRAFQGGLLDANDEAEVVRQLAQDPASRRRLVALADVAPPPAPAAVLERLLSQPRRSRRLRPILLAAAALTAVVVGWWWFQLAPAGLPPAYAVTINALAQQRDGQATDTQTASAYATTPVTITATVADAARASSEVGLFRLDGTTLVQVVEADGLVRADRRGAVQITAPAAALVGEEPGAWAVFVVVAWQGDLPSSIKVPRGHDPERTLAADGRRRVHRLPLQLLQPETPRDDPEPAPRR